MISIPIVVAILPVTIIFAIRTGWCAAFVLIVIAIAITIAIVIRLWMRWLATAAIATAATTATVVAVAASGQIWSWCCVTVCGRLWRLWRLWWLLTRSRCKVMAMSGIVIAGCPTNGRMYWLVVRCVCVVRSAMYSLRCGARISVVFTLIKWCQILLINIEHASRKLFVVIWWYIFFLIIYISIDLIFSICTSRRCNQRQ